MASLSQEIPMTVTSWACLVYTIQDLKGNVHRTTVPIAIGSVPLSPNGRGQLVPSKQATWQGGEAVQGGVGLGRREGEGPLVTGSMSLPQEWRYGSYGRDVNFEMRATNSADQAQARFWAGSNVDQSQVGSPPAHPLRTSLSADQTQPASLYMLPREVGGGATVLASVPFRPETIQEEWRPSSAAAQPLVTDTEALLSELQPYYLRSPQGSKAMDGIPRVATCPPMGDSSADIPVLLEVPSFDKFLEAPVVSLDSEGAKNQLAGIAQKKLGAPYNYPRELPALLSNAAVMSSLSEDLSWFNVDHTPQTPPSTGGSPPSGAFSPQLWVQLRQHLESAGGLEDQAGGGKEGAREAATSASEKQEPQAIPVVMPFPDAEGQQRAVSSEEEEEEEEETSNEGTSESEIASSFDKKGSEFTLPFNFLGERMPVPESPTSVPRRPPAEPAQAMQGRPLAAEETTREQTSPAAEDSTGTEDPHPTPDTSAYPHRWTEDYAPQDWSTRWTSPVGVGLGSAVSDESDASETGAWLRKGRRGEGERAHNHGGVKGEFQPMERVLSGSFFPPAEEPVEGRESSGEEPKKGEVRLDKALRSVMTPSGRSEREKEGGEEEPAPQGLPALPRRQSPSFRTSYSSSGHFISFEGAIGSPAAVQRQGSIQEDSVSGLLCSSPSQNWAAERKVVSLSPLRMGWHYSGAPRAQAYLERARAAVAARGILGANSGYTSPLNIFPRGRYVLPSYTGGFMTAVSSNGGAERDRDATHGNKDRVVSQHEGHGEENIAQQQEQGSPVSQAKEEMSGTVEARTERKEGASSDIAQQGETGCRQYPANPVNASASAPVDGAQPVHPEASMGAVPQRRRPLIVRSKSEGEGSIFKPLLVSPPSDAPGETASNGQGEMSSFQLSPAQAGPFPGPAGIFTPLVPLRGAAHRGQREGAQEASKEQQQLQQQKETKVRGSPSLGSKGSLLQPAQYGEKKAERRPASKGKKERGRGSSVLAKTLSGERRTSAEGKNGGNENPPLAVSSPSPSPPGAPLVGPTEEEGAPKGNGVEKGKQGEAKHSKSGTQWPVKAVFAPWAHLKSAGFGLTSSNEANDSSDATVVQGSRGRGRLHTAYSDSSARMSSVVEEGPGNAGSAPQGRARRLPSVDSELREVGTEVGPATSESEFGAALSFGASESAPTEAAPHTSASTPRHSGQLLRNIAPNGPEEEDSRGLTAVPREDGIADAASSVGKKDAGRIISEFAGHTPRYSPRAPAPKIRPSSAPSKGAEEGLIFGAGAPWSPSHGALKASPQDAQEKTRVHLGETQWEAVQRVETLMPAVPEVGGESPLQLGKVPSVDTGGRPRGGLRSFFRRSKTPLKTAEESLGKKDREKEGRRGGRSLFRRSKTLVKGEEQPEAEELQKKQRPQQEQQQPWQPQGTVQPQQKQQEPPPLPGQTQQQQEQQQEEVQGTAKAVAPPKPRRSLSPSPMVLPPVQSPMRQSQSHGTPVVSPAKEGPPPRKAVAAAKSGATERSTKQIFPGAGPTDRGRLPTLTGSKSVAQSLSTKDKEDTRAITPPTRMNNINGSIKAAKPSSLFPQGLVAGPVASSGHASSTGEEGDGVFVPVQRSGTEMGDNGKSGGEEDLGDGVGKGMRSVRKAGEGEMEAHRKEGAKGLQVPHKECVKTPEMTAGKDTKLPEEHHKDGARGREASALSTQLEQKMGPTKESTKGPQATVQNKGRSTGLPAGNHHRPAASFTGPVAGMPPLNCTLKPEAADLLGRFLDSVSSELIGTSSSSERVGVPAGVKPRGTMPAGSPALQGSVMLVTKQDPAQLKLVVGPSSGSSAADAEASKDRARVKSSLPSQRMQNGVAIVGQRPKTSGLYVGPDRKAQEEEVKPVVLRGSTSAKQQKGRLLTAPEPGKEGHMRKRMGKSMIFPEERGAGTTNRGRQQVDSLPGVEGKAGEVSSKEHPRVPIRRSHTSEDRDLGLQEVLLSSELVRTNSATFRVSSRGKERPRNDKRPTYSTSSARNKGATVGSPLPGANKRTAGAMRPAKSAADMDRSRRETCGQPSGFGKATSTETGGTKGARRGNNEASRRQEVNNSPIKDMQGWLGIPVASSEEFSMEEIMGGKILNNKERLS